MSRIRMVLGSTGAALMLMALMTVSLAQPPAGGPGGGPGGGRGFGGPGGGRGFGGPGGIYGLLDNAAVQEDLKLTDEQKAQVKAAGEALAKKRQTLFAGFGGGRNRGANAKNANGANANGNNADPNAAAPQPPDPETMRANMQALQKETEATYAKIISKAQRDRLTQIDLRRQGPMAVLRPDIAQRLNIGDDQMEEMQAIQNESRDQMKQAFQANRDMRKNFVDANGNFDRAAMKAAMDSPEGKAQQAAMQKQMGQLQNQTVAAISKVLTKKQKENFNKMLGKPFDVSLLGGPGGPGGRPGGPGAAGATPADAKAADATTTEKAKANGKTTSKKTTRKNNRKAAASNP